MSDNKLSCTAIGEQVHGYEIKRAIVFDNDRGFALAENPNAVSPFVTWQFTEGDNGVRDYYWGHYASNIDTAIRDYEMRVTEYQKDFGMSERDAYKYYSTQRPVDIGTFPKTENGPVRIVNFDTRERVEQGSFPAWGYLVYDAPLTEKQIADYELHASPDNLDVKKRMEEQAQVVGKWEQSKRVPDIKRLTWWYSDFGTFVINDHVTPEQMAERYNRVMESRDHAGQKKPIAEQLKEGAMRAERDNTPPVKKKSHTNEDR